MVEFRKPLPNRWVILAYRDDKLIAKITRYRNWNGWWLAQSLGAGLNLGGKSYAPGVKGFAKLAEAKAAIISAAEQTCL